MIENEAAARLGGAGYAVDVEPFAARASADPWLAGYAGMSALAAVLVYPLPLVAAVLGIAAVVLHARDSDGRPLLVRPSAAAANAVARGPHTTSPAFVIVTSSGLRPVKPRSLVVCLQVLMAAVPAAGAAAWIAEAESELPRPVATGGVAAAVALVALALVLYRPHDDPARRLDLTALAPRLRDENVWLVVLGPGGMAPFLDAHYDEVAGAAWLNLEPTPGDAVVAVSEEGTWRERRADRRLMGAAEEAGAEVRPYRVSTLVTPLLARRRRALTLLVPPTAEAGGVVAAVVRASSR